MKKFKRALSIFLVLVMLVGMIPRMAITSNSANWYWTFDLDGGTLNGKSSVQMYINLTALSGDSNWWYMG